MNYIEYYFGQHKDKKALYCLGALATPECLINLLNIHYFDEFYLIFEDEGIKDTVLLSLKENVDEKTVSNIKVVDAKESEKLIKGTPLVLDCTSSMEIMNELCSYKPSKLIGWFNRGFSTFNVWESVHSYVDKIRLAREVDEVKTEVLAWEKDINSDIELSVILPVYNVRKYLDKCINTLTEWKAPYVEFLFVDDGSPDDSEKLIKEYSKKDSRIKLLQKENGGCASARQFGLEKAKGRYIGFVDPDDFVDPTMFEKLLSSALMGTYDISYCRYSEYYDELDSFKEIEDTVHEPYCSGTDDLKLIDNLIAYLRVAIWRCIYRKEFIVNNNLHFYTDLRRFDDLPFKVETFARAKSVIAVDEALYFYRLGRPGQDVSVRDERLFVHFDIFKHLDNFFKVVRRSEQLTRYHQVKVQTHYWALINIDDEHKKEYLERASKDLGIENTKKAWKKVVKRYYKNREVNLFMKAIK